jgi:hypothetical protein
VRWESQYLVFSPWCRGRCVPLCTSLCNLLSIKLSVRRGNTTYALDLIQRLNMCR